MSLAVLLPQFYFSQTVNAQVEVFLRWYCSLQASSGRLAPVSVPETSQIGGERSQISSIEECHSVSSANWHLTDAAV